ncbi:cation:proton antiporter [Elongatibacter sediminis]|uniref:Cation:proton antiporter n=1 Tax=Elongatibacter sediminis TaxID=3119006 RepID=A0AAW9R9R2_9GAMM
MELLYILLILLVVTRACSELAVRMNQPALVGELLGGVLIGAVIALGFDASDAIAQLDEDETFQAVLDLAVFFLMLLAGIEMRPGDLARATGRAVPIALAGMLLPLALGFGLGWWWLPESDWKVAQSLFIGVALAITAVPVAVKVLVDLGQLQTRIGQVVIAAAVIDDVLSLILLAVLTSLITAGESVTAGSLLRIALNVAGFFAVAWVAGRYVLPRVGRQVRRLATEHADFSLLIIFGLALSVLAEWLDMHFLIGAFAAGVLFTRNVVGEDTHEKLESQTEAVTLGFLAPVFFASIGIHLNTDAILQAPLFLVVLLLAATVGKLAGSGIAARLAGFSGRESLAIGSAMNARGAVEIIIADIALRAGLFQHPDPPPPAIDYLFSAIVIMAIVTTLMTPLSLRRLLSRGLDGGGR